MVYAAMEWLEIMPHYGTRCHARNMITIVDSYSYFHARETLDVYEVVYTILDGIRVTGYAGCVVPFRGNTLRHIKYFE